VENLKKTKPKKRKTKNSDTNNLIFGYTWEDIQAMQNKTYKRRIIK